MVNLSPRQWANAELTSSQENWILQHRRLIDLESLLKDKALRNWYLNRAVGDSRKSAIYRFAAFLRWRERMDYPTSPKEWVEECLDGNTRTLLNHHQVQLYGDEQYPVDVSAVVFPVGAVVWKDKLLLYCGAGDKYVILLSCSLRSLVEYLWTRCRLDEGGTN